ncbi:MAG: hypothetical protein AB1796_02145 [Bacillota bacterium]
MKIILDGLEIPFADGLDKKIAGRLKQENLVIRSLKVNNVEMVNASLEEVLADPAAGKVVVINTAPAGELLRDAMLDARDYVPKLLGGLPEIRERLLEGNKKAVHALVDAALEGLEWLGLTFQAFISQGYFPAAEKVFTWEYSRLSTTLKELEAALRSGRMEAACDIFEQKIGPFLEKLLPLAEEMLQDEATGGKG